MRTTSIASHRRPRVAGLGRGDRRTPRDTLTASDIAAETVGRWPGQDDDLTPAQEWGENDGPDAEVQPWDDDPGPWTGEQELSDVKGPARVDSWSGRPASTGSDDDAVDLLEQAHDRLRTTAALRRVIEAVVDGLANGSGSDVALLRGDDQSGWHVVAGSGLRTLEVRPLAAIPPLVGRLHPGSPVLTVAETDAVRGELAGLPLSRHRSLLVLRHPTQLVTVMGRPNPYDEQDVELATSMLSAALPHLERGWRTESLLLSLVDWFEAEEPSDWP